MEKKHRPKETTGVNYRINTGCGHIYIMTGRNENGELIEIMATLGHAGGCAMSQLEALTRSISLGLKYGVPIEDLKDELEFIRCPTPAFDEGEEILSCADAIAKVLEKEIENSRIIFAGGKNE